MLIDSFMPEGITQLAVDSIFMMPQLGVLAHVDKKEFGEEARKAALEVFHKDCLIRLGTCITPVGRSKAGDVVMTAEAIPFAVLKPSAKKAADRSSMEV